MTKRPLSRVRGFVHDIQTVAALSDEPDNLRLLSDRSLYILQNLSGEDITFLSRYGEILDNNYYNPVQQGTTEAQEVEYAVDIIRRDLNDMTIEQTLQCVCDRLGEIATAITNASNTTQVCVIGSGSAAQSGAQGGDPPGEVNGVPYDFPDAITDRKCKAANYIHGQIKGVIQQWIDNNVSTMTFAGLSLVLTVVSATIAGVALGPFGALVGALVGGVLSIATLIFEGQVDLDDILAAMVADEAGAICALYEAVTADDASQAYLDHIAAEGATALEVQLLSYIVSTNLTNLLFFAWGDSEDVIDNATIISDCSGCSAPLAAWYWPSNLEGWTPFDESTGNCVGVVSTVWQTPTYIKFAASSCSNTAWAGAQSPTLSIPSDGTLQLRWYVIGTDFNVSEGIWVQFASSPDELIWEETYVAEQENIAAITTVDTIIGIKWRFGRQTGNFTRLVDYMILEVAP